MGDGGWDGEKIEAGTGMEKVIGRGRVSRRDMSAERSTEEQKTRREGWCKAQ